MQKEQTNLLCKVSWLDKTIRTSSVPFQTGKSFKWSKTIKINSMDKLFVYFQFCPSMVWKRQNTGLLECSSTLRKSCCTASTQVLRELKLAGVTANNWKISYLKMVTSCEKPYFQSFLSSFLFRVCSNLWKKQYFSVAIFVNNNPDKMLLQLLELMIFRVLTNSCT